MGDKETRLQNLDGKLGVLTLAAGNSYKGKVVGYQREREKPFQVLQKPWRAGWNWACKLDQDCSTREHLNKMDVKLPGICSIGLFCIHEGLCVL